MKQAFLDECYMSRMDYLRERFPMEDFRNNFKHEYTRRGFVMIQDKTHTATSCGMVLDDMFGFIFGSQHHLDTALRLVRWWGFSVTKRCEHDGQMEYSAYIVQLPYEYIRRKAGSYKAGEIHTGLRSISNIDRTKKQKETII